MKMTKKDSLLDFIREEASRLEMMNSFLSSFREKDIVYVCSSDEGSIPGYKTVKYEVTGTVPGRFKVRRPLFGKPELIILQKPQLLARCLGGTHFSSSSVNNYLKYQIAVSDTPSDQISFTPGIAEVYKGTLKIRQSMTLKVFGSSYAYARSQDDAYRYDTFEEFDSKWISGSVSHQRCIARISPLPVIVYPH